LPFNLTGKIETLCLNVSWEAFGSTRKWNTPYPNTSLFEKLEDSRFASVSLIPRAFTRHAPAPFSSLLPQLSYILIENCQKVKSPYLFFPL